MKQRTQNFRHEAIIRSSISYSTMFFVKKQSLAGILALLLALSAKDATGEKETEAVEETSHGNLRKLWGDECTWFNLDFDDVNKGDYVDYQWVYTGLVLSASGGANNKPRVFDTGTPTNGNCGDEDLGSPNVDCWWSGPGVGAGGAPWQPGRNCDKLGNVIIIQEPGASCPDDNVNGGKIVFDFNPKAEYVQQIGLLDIDYQTTITVDYYEGGVMKQKIIPVPQLGDNSYQLLWIGLPQVEKIVMTAERSAAITSLKYCYNKDRPHQTPEQTTPHPPTTPSPDTCNPVKVDFDKDANGNSIEKGRYVKDEWSQWGLTLKAGGGEGTKPRIFDSSDPGSEDTCGDADLGSPNKKCSGKYGHYGHYGPGIGIGGEPGAPGENCYPLGNLLIVQEPGSPCPDDNKNGGFITFEFKWGQYVDSIGLVDIDYKTTITVAYKSKYGLKYYDINVPELGDNSKQTVDIKQKDVVWLKLNFTRSGGVSFIKFCPKYW